jgi:hypothetical protein
VTRGLAAAAVGFLGDAAVLDGLAAALSLFVEGGVAPLIAALAKAVEVLVFGTGPGNTS